jgi:hypothetical protein
MTQRFAIVPVPDHQSPPAEAILVGPLEECLGCISMGEYVERMEARSAQLDAREAYLIDLGIKLTAVVPKLNKIFDDEVQRRDSFEKQRAISAKRAEAEQKRRDRQRVAAYLDTLPDPDEPEPLLPTKGDNGELTVLHKPDPVEHGYEHDPDDPDTWPQDDDTGLEAVSATRPTTAPAQLAYPPSRSTKQVPQPIAISLNEE